MKSNVTNSDQFLNLDTLDEALQVRAAVRISETFKKLSNSIADEMEKTNSLFSMEILKMTEAHFMYIIFKTFKDFIVSHKFKCPKVKENLGLIAMVYALTELQKDSIPNYESGYFK